MNTERKISILLFALAITLIFSGFVYDVVFAGIPYQDPTPAMEARYNLHSQVASLIRWSGVGISLVGGFSLAIHKIKSSKV